MRVVLACVCGSDLWYYRGESPHDRDGIGHEFVGIVEAAGAAVRNIEVGDLVIAPFAFSDGTCPNCLAGVQTACLHGGFFGGGDDAGGQAELVRVPQADGTLVAVPTGAYDDATMRSFLTLSDVMGTGHHAAMSAGVQAGDTVAVVGDGAVGLSAILAAKRLGAARIIALSRNPARQALAREFGATDAVAERADAVDRRGAGADRRHWRGRGARVCGHERGHEDRARRSSGRARPSATSAFRTASRSAPQMFRRNVGLKGRPRPSAGYLPELLADVLAGTINPGRVFDFETGPRARRGRLRRHGRATRDQGTRAGGASMTAASRTHAGRRPRGLGARPRLHGHELVVRPVSRAAR